LNVAFVEEGLITLGEDGKVTSWQAFCNTSDGTAQIHVNNEHIKDEIYELLKSWQKKYGIKTIYTKEQCREKGVDGSFEFMVEARDGYYFRNFYKTHAVVEKIEADNHGYDSHREDYKSLFLAFGKSIKEGIALEEGRLVDMASTFAEILGLDFEETHGKPLKALLKI